MAYRIPFAQDFLKCCVNLSYSQMRRYTPRLLEAFAFKAAPVAQRLLDGIDTIKAMNAANARSMPFDSNAARSN